MHSIGLVPDKRDQKKERLRIACAHRCRCPKPHLYDAVPEEVPEGNTLRIISPARLNRQVLARVRGGEKGRSRRLAQPMHCTRTCQLAQSLDERFVCLHPQVWAISVGAEGVELRFSDGGGTRRLPFTHRGLDYYARGAALEASALKHARQVRLLGDGASPPPPRLNEILAHLPATCTISIDRLARTASTPLAFPPLTTIRLSAWHLSGPAASRLVMGAHGARRLSLALSPALGRLHPLLPSHAEARGRGTVLLNRAVSVLSLWISGGPQRPKAEDVLSALRLLFADLHSDQIAQGLRVEIDSDWRRFGGDLSPSALVYLVADLFRTDPRCVVLNSRGVWGMAERKPPIAPSSLGIP